METDPRNDAAVAMLRLHARAAAEGQRVLEIKEAINATLLETVREEEFYATIMAAIGASALDMLECLAAAESREIAGLFFERWVIVMRHQFAHAGESTSTPKS